jgi:drug/metabolite transporter (DMT)-like permease
MGKEVDEDKFIPVHYFLLFACIDIHATLLIVNSFLFTSITSVMLLEDSAIPCVFLLSIFFLKIKYVYRHYFAIILCFCGLACSISNDLYIKNKADLNSTLPYPISKRMILGDLMAIGGACLYGLSNVL